MSIQNVAQSCTHADAFEQRLQAVGLRSVTAVYVLAGAALVLLFAPALVVLIVSFTSGLSPRFPLPGFICFMASFNNILVSLFLRDAVTDMLPIRMWQDLKGTLDITIATLSGVLIVATVAVMLLMQRLVGLSRRLT
ncbi:MAG: hypothetical protein ACRYHQ_27720 [Janthinobacterium lividum]